MVETLAKMTVEQMVVMWVWKRVVQMAVQMV